MLNLGDVSFFFNYCINMDIESAIKRFVKDIVDKQS